MENNSGNDKGENITDAVTKQKVLKREAERIAKAMQVMEALVKQRDTHCWRFICLE